MNILEWRNILIKKFSPMSLSPQTDADLLLMHVIQASRAQLLLHLHDVISDTDEKTLQQLMKRRAQGEPMAYLLSSQPFWTMDLFVTKDTLIPRPETECLIDWILHSFSAQQALQIADLGTGSGAIAIALALEKKQWRIDACDVSAEALAIAKKNADHYHIQNIAFYISDWFQALTEKKYHVIVSNPPYIAEQDPHLQQLQFEPQDALLSGQDGLNAIRTIVENAKLFLLSRGALVIEHGYDQAEAVRQLFQQAGFQEIKNHRDLADIPRFVTGCIA